MSCCAPECSFAGSFDDHNGNAKTHNLDSADQTVRAGRGDQLYDGFCRCLRRVSRLMPHIQQVLETLFFAMLERGPIHHNERAIAKRHHRAGKERSLGPPENRNQRCFLITTFMGGRQDAWMRRYCGCHIESSTC